MKKLIKKFLVVCGIITAVSVATNLLTPQTVSAYGTDCRYFLGMTSWDCKVIENVTSEDQLKTNIWTIAGNVSVNITVLVAYLIIGYVIYGGYLYMFSSGDPNKITTGKKALTHAFIGLAITMLANVILNAIRIALGANFTENCAMTNACYDTDTAGQMIISVIQWVVGIAGIISVIFIVYGGISYMTSSGDSNKLQKAKNTIIYALIGLAIVGLAETITAFVSNAIREAGKTSLIETRKEYHETKEIS